MVSKTVNPALPMWYEPLLEKSLLPDWLIRTGIRQLLGATLKDLTHGGPPAQEKRKRLLLEELKKSPIALNTSDANTQHYEVPPPFFHAVLGSRMKYSSGYWPDGTTTLDGGEEAMLFLTARRAKIQSGDRVLDLGCGWGSFSLYIAEKFPACSVVGVSHSHSQKEWIDQEKTRRGLTNLTIITADMNHFAPTEKFDRVVSVEMFEHMRNYQALLRRIASWTVHGGLLFVHIFAHRQFPYLFQDSPENPSWITRYFFAGGIMPSDDLLTHFQDHFTLQDHWRVNGKHYQRTCEAWLRKMDGAHAELFPLFQKTYGKDAQKMWAFWRIFFMSCGELFGYHQGEEWFVSHYLFQVV